MLRDRLISAGVAIVILVPILLVGGAAGIAFLVALFGGIALWEIARCLPALKTSPGKEVTLVLGIGLVAAFYLVPPSALVAVLIWYPLLAIIIHLFVYHRIERSVESASQMIFALAYVIAPLSHAILLRRLEMGVAWIFFVLLVVCLGDTGAYFAGRFLGKHPLWPSVSPSKTVEGLGGCLVGGLLGMLVVKTVFPGLPSIQTLLFLTVALVVAGPLGDLCASMIKRKLDIKDFGSIMPGHGGVMDRADSLILAFPVTYYFLLLLSNSAPK